MQSKWFKEKEKLEKLILEDKLSYEEIGKIYNCSGTNIKKVAIRIGIKLEDRRIVNPNETFGKGLIKVPLKPCINCGKLFKVYAGYTNKYCSNNCALEYKHKQKYQLILDGDPSIMRANYSPDAFRKDILKEQDNKCAICGISSEWNGKELVFIIDHIDGHAANNKRENLRCICPNCDSQLDTYKSKNKNGDRYYYRYGRYKQINENSRN